jgi:GT2 family glycosyltransferase
VTLIQVSDQKFWAGATNAGVKVALDLQVSFILTINDDAVINIDHIARLVALAQQHQLYIVGNRIDYLTPIRKVWSLGTYTDWGSDRFLKIAYMSATTFLIALTLAIHAKEVRSSNN